MEDTMDRPNDPGGASSSSPILTVPDVPTIQAEAPQGRKSVPTMPTRAERAFQMDNKDVDMAVISGGHAARTAE
eukprot:16435844-Heterocapsa_arctica.AAC.1